MTIVEFTNNIDNIKINNKINIDYPLQSSFYDDNEYQIIKIYNNLQINSDININVGDYIYDAQFEISTVYPITINGNSNYVVNKGLFESEEILINEIILQNKASEFELSDPIVFAYILEDEYGLIMKKYEDTLFRIFDSPHCNIEDKIRYLDKIKIMLENLSEKAKIHHSNFNLCNIMTKGIPYYAKFGFVFVDDTQNQIMQSNKEKITKLKLEDLKLNILIYTILDTLVRNSLYKIYKYDFIKGIHNIMQIYKQALDEKLSLIKFLNIIAYNECQIMAIIYHNLYKLLKLEYYTDNKMILYL